MTLLFFNLLLASEHLFRTELITNMFYHWSNYCLWSDLRSLLFHFREENLAKINKRVSDYKVEIRNPPRSGKKLLVLDVDYTIFG